MKKVFTPIFVTMLTVAVCSGFAQVPAAPVSVKISIGEQPPLMTEKGGIIDKVAAEALKRGGYAPEFEWLPIGRMLTFLEKDALDLYISASNTAAQHNPHVHFLAAKGVFFYLKKNTPAQPVTRLEDLAGKKVGTVTHSPLTEMYQKAGIIVDEGPFETMFKKLEAGRVDFVSTADVGGILTISQLFPGREGEFTFTEFSYSTLGAGLYAKPGPKGEAILEAARKGFASMKADGTLDRMLMEFFGKEHAPRVYVY